MPIAAQRNLLQCYHAYFRYNLMERMLRLPCSDKQGAPPEGVNLRESA